MAINATNDLYSNYKNWLNNHTIKATIETYGQEENYPDLYSQVKDTESTFSLMEALAQGELSAKDTNKDGQISLSEFVSAEIGDLAEVNYALGMETSQDELALTAAYSELLFNLLDQAFPTSDKNGSIGIEELQSFYLNTDKFENGEQINEADGTFVIDEEQNFTEYLITGTFNQEMIGALYAQYENEGLNTILQDMYAYYSNKITKAQS